MCPQKHIPSAVKDPKLIETRRQQIVAAAVNLFVKKGFHGTTTREIARESGLSIGALYEYVESKEDVLYLVCDNIHTTLETRLRRTLTEAGNGRESLRSAIRQYLYVMDDMQDDVLLIYQESKSLPLEALRFVLGKEEQITGIFADILRRGIEDGSLRLDPGAVTLMAHNIIVLGQMWAFRRWALQRHYTLEEYIRVQTSLLLNELMSPDETDDTDTHDKKEQGEAVGGN
ncbi:TetR family transcriptional regulator [Kyrpidia spormannii]|uniref:TetR family transcriptional regulator n=1 Tax=Kyrpidia spormannii TaxID=2055160 RepID=A0A2K8N7Q0_9BACL|nr:MULTISPECIES: TetR/AcrR family transcriptional regulator [Kyrpidia]ATY85364.1 TetR family transcriptional regulator [Kyrpidia spormannii]MCL6576291.1 TetR/AcrR family transcriptional regulator [Kyrpidia sp.]HHY68538.1 TetR/AcrR family transcriptional regulator [Alicyclobacillus sp.]